MAESSGTHPVGIAVRQYCRARVAPVHGLARADELAAVVLAEVAVDATTPFGREAYRAVARAVDLVLAEPRRKTSPPAGSLAAAVEDLPAPIRDVLVLRAFVGLSRDQVAQALGVSDRTVLRRQQAGLAWLRAEHASTLSAPEP